MDTADEEQGRKSYNPLSFYSPDPIKVNKSLQLKLLNKNYIPLSLFTYGSTADRRRQSKRSAKFHYGSTMSPNQSMNGRIDLDHWMYTGSFDGHEVYVDGTCHWLFTKDDSKEQHTVVTLLSFDLSNQAFITTPIGEESITPHTYNRRLAVLNASIALLSNYDDNIVFHISILGQLGVTESWTKLYICGPLPSLEWPPYGFGKMGYMFFEKTDGELAYVDLSTQKIEEVDITTRSACLFTVGLYKKSLLSIRGSSK
ncbi:uncharacterized protein LOC131628412 isoform X2 [Vicia villosa]|uniref:uncharacterized protein LOC131628412 isoform X2 n=1 Tax=Vicia villosa TaxID=3911 RepID=UPI00273C7204|nr:uncharacterized protein LOC131628412 isoform X2 [Vicia villosa]